MQTQSEKLEWILNSLFKMVKLEQNVMVFEVSMCPIRKTILDAVNLVYEKAARKQIPIKTGISRICFFITMQSGRQKCLQICWKTQ